MVDDVHPLEITWSVTDVINNGQWALHRLRTPLSTATKQMIQALPITPRDVTDTIVWKGSKMGVPITKSFFKFISQTEDRVTQTSQ